MLIRELRLPVSLILAVLLVGILGFRIVEGWTWLDSAWMALITMTTIGFGEVHPLTQAGRLFAMVYILAAVGAGGYAVAQLSGYLMDGRFALHLRNQRRARHMKALRKHYIVVGYGRLGREVVEDLRHHHCQVVVVDTEDRSLQDLGAGVHHVRGDGSSDAVLREAGIEHARAIAIATPSTAVNVYITLSARQLNASLYISTRVDEQGADEKARRAGANATVSPFPSAGSQMAHRLMHPHAAEFLEQLLSRANPALVIDDIRIRAGSKLAGRLADLRLRERFSVGVIAIRRPDGALETVPASQSILGIGDVAVVAGSEDAVALLRAAFEAE
ncbi:MAG: potassium channel protein [Myxococcales bacterium]|nr:potassium channel protein [Myxococcales bacterium]